MYRLLNNGRAPFIPDFPNLITAADRDLAQERRVKGDPLPPLKSVSPALNAIMLKAAAYNSRDRYPSPTAMREAIEALKSGHSIAPDSPRENLEAKPEMIKESVFEPTNPPRKSAVQVEIFLIFNA
jgi:hypothetical protein